MQQNIEQSTDVLKSIISPAMHEGDMMWPPRDPDTLTLMEKVSPHLSLFSEHSVNAPFKQILLYSLYVTQKMCCEYVMNCSTNALLMSFGRQPFRDSIIECTYKCEFAIFISRIQLRFKFALLVFLGNITPRTRRAAR
jgi:hypothetical protein